MAYTRQRDNLNFVINNYSDEEDNFDPNYEYSAKSQRSNNDPYYPKVDPLSHPSDHKYAHTPHYKFLPTAMPSQTASLLVFPYSVERSQFMCPSVLPFSTKGFDKASSRKRPPNIAEIRLVLSHLSTLGGVGSGEEAMDNKILFLILSLLIIVILLFVMLYIGPFWFFVGHHKTFIFFMTMIIAAVAFWGYLNIKTTEDDHSDSVRKFEKVLDRVNMEWEVQKVDGYWRIGKEGGWIELEVTGRYTQRNRGGTTNRTIQSHQSKPNFHEPRTSPARRSRSPVRGRSRSPTGGSTLDNFNRSSPNYKSAAKFKTYQDTQPGDNDLKYQSEGLI